ncbi:AAA family ATPase [Peptostreptococcus equinus]|uniref:AAA family ATPase n=1 Tax=Peptostreptococcus equinus TaxID=3003601 RepID=A0ABY7JQM3_9FIRM|nr:AAA family ATPase [Peptostreptococcus sp. CBA3647]WAW15655.1 AAA family ATPase [Peptostreptococcus sp. CBA3647]
MKKFLDIQSNLDALKPKKFEERIYSHKKDNEFVIPKVIPFKGINTDMLYIKDGRILFIKYMDTTEELFTLLDEELLEIMKEEHDLLFDKMKKNFPEISYNYVFVMPFIEEIEYKYGMDDFIDKHVIIGDKANSILKSTDILEDYLKDQVDEIIRTIFLQKICSEYFTITEKINTNKNLKKINYYKDDMEYKLSMMDENQIVDICSTNYGNHAIIGGANTGKTTLMLGRMIKLAKIYPHHKFLYLTYTKQQANYCKDLLDLMDIDIDNIELLTFSSFIFKLAKINNLVIDYQKLKNNYDKSFDNLMKQVDNSVKNKRMFKGIFISEAENFNESELVLIHEFLYSTKNIFNVSLCKAYNINNNLNIYKCRARAIEYEDETFLNTNYRQSQEIVEFTNSFCDKANSYIATMRTNLSSQVFAHTNALFKTNDDVNIIRVEDIDDQINAAIWEVEHLVNDLGYKYNEIAIIYPYNKKKLKNGKIIYFQYMLRKTLEDHNIQYIFAEDTVTNLTPKIGITISNIYTAKSLSFKAVIVCELEMLYNHKVEKNDQDYLVNDFVGDLNKVYTALTRAYEHLSIVLSYDREKSDIINIIESSKQS